MSKVINISDYLDLITVQHATQPNYISYCTAFLDMIQAGCDALYSFDTVFNLSTATGDALDKLAYIAGISRVLPIDDPDIPSSLSDDTLRLLIKSKIKQNHWNGTLAGWMEILQVIFPESAFDVIDNQNMTVNVTIIDPSFDDEKIALLMNGYLLPKPSGVRLVYTVIDSALFGWDTNTAFIKGWDEGEWATT